VKALLRAFIIGPRISWNKRRLAGDTARAATSAEVKDLRHEAQELKAVVAEQALELRPLKKSMIADGGDEE
jgi:transposase